MKKVFYLIITLGVFFVACTKKSNKGAMEAVAKSLKKGESGILTYEAADGVVITADYYPNKDASQLIVLLHQADFSRGAYKNIAPRLVDSGFACLAVDLRGGKIANEVYNETQKSAESLGLSTGYIEALKDIVATTTYVLDDNELEIVLWGSSYSASLALMHAAIESRVAKVVAFSPGEYLSNQNTVRSTIADLDKPVFLTGGSAEFDLVVQPIISGLPKAKITQWKPTGRSDHGSKTLWQPGEATDQLYTMICAFLRK